MQNLYIKIPDGANVVIDKLYENGHSAFVVGGCVRDFILEKEPHDWDICTDALPEQVMQIFGEKNVIPTGIKHGTVTVLIGNDNYEVTTYRIDGMYSDGRRPDNVEFTQNLIEDLSRRDFSINAMAYNDKIGLIDPFDGISDIKNRRICCVGDPGKRFGEDYLRILRAIRFSSTFGFIIDKHTRMVAAINAPNLRMLANERVGAEIRKILCGRYAADARWFGMVNTSYSSYNTLGKIEGAFQLSFPMSYDPIRIASISNTRCCVSSDDERKGNEKVPKNKDRTMGRFSVVEYGLYHMYIQTSTKAILRNGVTEDDLKLLIQTILHMFDDDMSSVRPSMTVRKVVVVRQNRNSGRVRPTDIEDAMVAKLKPGVNSPTSFNDYNLEFKRDMLPDSVEVKEYTMDNPDGIIL